MPARPDLQHDHRTDHHSGYSAMSGVIGGGGLGKIALSYGYYRYQTDIMIVCVILLVLMVQVFQTLGTAWATRSDKRCGSNSFSRTSCASSPGEGASGEEENFPVLPKPKGFDGRSPLLILPPNGN